jgi:DNA-binding LytR/AlgR family response regulator
MDGEYQYRRRPGVKIAICDDNVREIEQLRDSILAHTHEHEIREFLSAAVFLQRLHDGEQFDLLFLDIQMPDADGWEIAWKLKQAEHKVFIAMVSVRGEYIYDCFDRVDWFAPKPVARKKVWQILNSAQARLFPMVFEFPTDTVTIALTAPEIIYLEVRRNTLCIHAASGCYELRMPLKKAKEMLQDHPQFVQSHSSFIINLDHYGGMKESYIVLENREEIKLSRTYRDSFFKALTEYIRGV